MESQRTETQNLLFGILRPVVRGLIALLVAIVLTIFVPGIVAKRHKVFTDDDVRNSLKNTIPLAWNILETYESQRKQLNDDLRNLQRNFDSLPLPEQQKQVDSYARLLEAKQKEVAALKPPIFAKGFFLSPQMLLFPAVYGSLVCLLVCFEERPRILKLAKYRQTVIWLGLLIYVYYEWPLWTRNFLLKLQGRTVYSYTNYDIDKFSFFIQEATIAGFAFLVAAVWMRWASISAAQCEALKSRDSDDYFNPDFILSIHQEFSVWIIRSIILGLGFAYFTTFYWNLVGEYHDDRYLTSAFLAHSLWVITWGFVSLPLIMSWNILKRRRLRMISALVATNASTPADAAQLTVERLEKLESMAGVRLSIAGVGAVISMLLPILQLFIHKK